MANKIELCILLAIIYYIQIINIIGSKLNNAKGQFYKNKSSFFKYTKEQFARKA